MRKRLRKKRHLSEFQELGFEVTFQIHGFEDSEQETDRLFEFLDEAIEANGMYFGGSGKEGKWSGVVYSLNRHGSPMTEDRRELVISWLRANNEFEFIEASNLFDVWYGELPSESEKPQPNRAIPADRDPRERGSRPLNSNRYVRREMDQIQSIVESEIYFQNADHMDIKTIEGEVSLRQFISAMLSYYPWWILFLYRIRAFLVSILGLVKHEKPTVLPSIRPKDLSFTPGENASFFIVKSAKENVYWISETPKDKHLRAFFGVVAETISAQVTKFHVFTSVYYIHWTGPIYFNIIRPFHHLVVSSMMRYGIKKKENT